MKKLILNSLFAVAALFTTSCTDNDSVYYIYTYATVNNSSATAINFTLDNGKTLSVVDNQSGVSYPNFDPGDRNILAISTVTNEESLYDYEAILYEVASVTMGTSMIIADENENDMVPTDALDISQYATLTYGYLNILTSFTSSSSSGVDFYLVENPYLEAIVDDSDYLNLELRFSNGGSATGSTYQKYVSFDMDTFRELMENKVGIALHFYSATEEEIGALKIDKENLY